MRGAVSDDGATWTRATQANGRTRPAGHYLSRPASPISDLVGSLGRHHLFKAIALVPTIFPR
jgi:hypothetical protein